MFAHSLVWLMLPVAGLDTSPASQRRKLRRGGAADAWKDAVRRILPIFLERGFIMIGEAV